MLLTFLLEIKKYVIISIYDDIAIFKMVYKIIVELKKQQEP